MYDPDDCDDERCHRCGAHDCDGWCDEFDLTIPAEPCPRCHRAEGCACPVHCEWCGRGSGWLRDRPDVGKLCGRCAEDDRDRTFPRARNERGTPRQRRLRRLHAHQRPCGECGRRANRHGPCDCIPF